MVLKRIKGGMAPAVLFAAQRMTACTNALARLIGPVFLLAIMSPLSFGCSNALIAEVNAMRTAAITPSLITLDAPEYVAVFENGSTSPLCNTSLKLNWGSVSTATSYNIFRELSASGNFTAKLQQYTPASNAGTIEWIDTTTAPGIEYYYKIQAVSLVGISRLNSVLAVSKKVPGTPVASLELSSAVIVKGQTSTVNTSYLPLDASVKTATWTSTVPGVATVDAAGLVTAIAKGTTIIKATSSDNTGVSCNLILTVIPDHITTIAGTGSTTPDNASGPGTTINLNYPYLVALDSAGDIYVTDTGHYRIRKIDRNDSSTTTVAGNGCYGALVVEGALATDQPLNSNMGLAIDSGNNLYIALYDQNRVRKVTAGIINTVAGPGTGGPLVDGQMATSANIGGVSQIAVDLAGNMYIGLGLTIYKVTASTGKIAHIAGNGSGGIATDGGDAVNQGFYVGQMAISSTGDIYFPDYINNIILKIVQSTGKVHIMAGNGTSGYSGDGGQAKMAQLKYPSGVALDSAGNLYISDTNNHRIRVVSPSGIITTIAGDGTANFAGDGGTAVSAQLKNPAGLVVDSSGMVYFADSSNHRIRKLY